MVGYFVYIMTSCKFKYHQQQNMTCTMTNELLNDYYCEHSLPQNRVGWVLHSALY
jgi:hypothetical protein